MIGGFSVPGRLEIIRASSSEPIPSCSRQNVPSLMHVQGFGGVVGGEVAEVAVSVHPVAALRFHLDREVLDAELGSHLTADGVEQLVGEGGIVAFHHDVTGQHHEARLDGPDMQIVHVLHARDLFDRLDYVRRFDAGRR